MTAFVPALLAKVTLIFAAGLILTALMHRASASLRHLVLSAAILCGLTLPIVMLVSPRWDVSMLPSPIVANTNDEAPTGVVQSEPASLAPPALPISAAPTFASVQQRWERLTHRAPTRTSSRLDPAAAIPLAYLIGLISIVAWLAIGRWRLRRIAREAWPLAQPEWNRILDAVRTEAGVTREVRLLSSSVVSTPLTWGTRAPVILLPEDAIDWDDDHRRVVLRHEIAHVSRGDSLSQLVAGLVCAIYWFHPLAWITERKLRAECERACDDRVVSLGTPAADYAAHLLEVARSARAFGAPGFLSVAMARPTQLEGRLLAVLNESRHRVAASRAERFAAIAISALVMLPLAAFRPVERSAPKPTEINDAPRILKPKSDDAAKHELKPVVREDKRGSTVKPDAQKTFDSTFQLSAPVRSGGTLYIDLNTGGGITIRPWDRSEVQVRARLGGRDWRQTRVTLEPSNGGATLASEFTESSGNTSTSHDFDIQLPREFNVRIKSSGGSISIANMSGSFTGSTGGGEIDIRSVNGRVELNTGGGEVYVADSNIDGHVGTGGGQVRILRVNGRFNGSSGSGPVIYSESSGGGKGFGKGEGVSVDASAGGSASASATGRRPIRMEAAGGSLSLPSAPNGAHVTTGGGKITIGESGGAVYAQTGGGDIDIGPTRGSVEAITGAGDVSIDFIEAGSVELASGSGRVTINVPRDLNATLDLETAYTIHYRGKTRIVSDWPVSVTETSEWENKYGTPRRYVRVRQQVGNGGPLIRVRTVNGDIILRRGS
ncbi:MAG TPA: M56 family metallopeptidase [Gemmatimonadaceae bacterium]|nr:M56 family metallopeptidase [Gemmatimonadaceae bacterium]